MTELMVTCLTQSKEGGGEGLRQLTIQRLKHPEEVTDEDFEKPEHEQPIVLTESLCILLQM